MPELVVAEDQPFVVGVVAQLRREGGVTGHGEDQLAVRVLLDVMEERVELEHHRRALVAAQQCLGHVAALDGEAPERDARRRLRRQADLDIGHTVAGVDPLEMPRQVRAQRLGVPLAAEERPHAVRRPVHAAPLALVEEHLEERRVAHDEIPMPRPQLDQGAEHLVEVRPGGFHQAALLQGRRGRHARGPGAHREGVQHHQRLVSERVAREERDHPADVAPLLGAAHPVVRRAGGTGALVDGRADQREAPVQASLGERVGVDVRVLVGLRQVAQVADPVRFDAVPLEEVAVGRHAPAGLADGAQGPRLAERIGGTRRHDLQEPLQRAVATAHAAQEDLERPLRSGSGERPVPGTGRNGRFGRARGRWCSHGAMVRLNPCGTTTVGADAGEW